MPKGRHTFEKTNEAIIKAAPHIPALFRNLPGLRGSHTAELI